MELLDPLLDPLRSGIGRRALLEIALLGAFCGALGFWVVTERLTYAASRSPTACSPASSSPHSQARRCCWAAGGALVAAALVALAVRDPRIGPTPAPPWR